MSNRGRGQGFVWGAGQDLGRASGSNRGVFPKVKEHCSEFNVAAPQSMRKETEMRKEERRGRSEKQQEERQGTKE